MSTLQMSHVIDLEQGNHEDDAVVGGVGSDDDDGSVYLSDAEEGGSSHSHFYSTHGDGGSAFDDCSFSCVSDLEAAAVVHDSGRASFASDFSVELGNAAAVPEIKVHLDNNIINNNHKVERDCRICHMGLESDSSESGVPIELGCACKDDLAAAHKICAETWFKIKGNLTCEICHYVARNVHGTTDHSSDGNNPAAIAALSTHATPAEARRFWHGHRFLNFLLACMVFAFVISWLFHFNVPSS
ncbi:hypothetical protein HN51_005008 [Arachis hypogaea]|uniref:RING-CH-type domain-containing protein n=2 Tax=Arachis TaxID=3817 RepID=A0A445DGF4_ARAHY|nr:uncharacterized protein LOC107484647 [Arachis duranensis]XP_025695311.1 uncharacterized protein LOC112796868 [Arachis hypogaea]QHO38705.1 uncharacterized protein DS421_4g122670 [Arachis hypogaea]RYR62268.1 hypothetical protein Ahy_A04g019717 [Arachis hypogaea]